MFRPTPFTPTFDEVFDFQFLRIPSSIVISYVLKWGERVFVFLLGIWRHEDRVNPFGSGPIVFLSAKQHQQSRLKLLYTYLYIQILVFFDW